MDIERQPRVLPVPQGRRHYLERRTYDWLFPWPPNRRNAIDRRNGWDQRARGEFAIRR